MNIHPSGQPIDPSDKIIIGVFSGQILPLYGLLKLSAMKKPRYKLSQKPNFRGCIEIILPTTKGINIIFTLKTDHILGPKVSLNKKRMDNIIS